MYLVTNADGAVNYKVVAAPASDPRKTNWKLEIPPRLDVKIEDMDMFEVRTCDFRLRH